MVSRYVPRERDHERYIIEGKKIPEKKILKDGKSRLGMSKATNRETD